MSADILDLLVQMSRPGERETAARMLADRLGVESVLLLVRDSQLGVLLPAQGLPQTLRGGPAWRSFVERCARPGQYEGEIDLPAGTHRPALALAVSDAAVVLVGGAARAAELPLLAKLLPMLAQALRSEQEVWIARAETVEAREAANRAEGLARALEGARAEGAKLNAELREEHRRKDDFLAMLAHELRNPLAPLVTSLELLRRQPSNATLVSRQAEVMARQVSQLTRLVEDLLEVSRVSRGRIGLRRRALVLGDVLTDALEASRPFLEGRRHRVDLALPPDPIVLHADNVRLAQVFANLLHNAAKYTDPGGGIRITAERVQDSAVVRIVDTGIGIAPEILPRVFDLFAQAPASLERAQGGLGLGLTLVRALVELHGGRVTAESRGLGQGSAFTVYLPVAAGELTVPPQVPARPPATAPRAQRVLVVDDNSDSADALGQMLQMMGHHPRVVYSGLTALQVAPDVDPDLILLDIGLPEMDGYEVARRLRRVLRPESRVIALTGYGSEADRRRSREAGFDEHIVKPMTVEILERITTFSSSANDAPTVSGRGG